MQHCTAAYLQATAPPTSVQRLITRLSCSPSHGLCKLLGTSIDGRLWLVIGALAILVLTRRRIQESQQRLLVASTLVLLFLASIRSSDISFQRTPKRERLPSFVGPHIGDARWRAYLHRVYGSFSLLAGEKLDLDAFTFFYLDWLLEAGIDISKYEIGSDECCSSNSFIKSNGTLWRGLQRADHPYNMSKSDTWVEIMHCFHANWERGYWTYRARGSGVWMHTGASIVLRDHDSGHASALASWAPKKLHMADFAERHSFDSYQYLQPEYNCAPMELIFTHGDGNKVCGGATLRAGFRADHVYDQCNPSHQCIRDASQPAQRPPRHGGGRERFGSHSHR